MGSNYLLAAAALVFLHITPSLAHDPEHGHHQVERSSRDDPTTKTSIPTQLIEDQTSATVDSTGTGSSLVVSSTTTDLFILDELSPIEFSYEASLSVLDGQFGTMLPHELIHTGQYWRCPATWNVIPMGTLEVNRQQRHYLSGRIESQTRVVAHDAYSPNSRNLLVRSIDEMSGSCTIRKLWYSHNHTDDDEQQQQQLLMTLDFGDQTILVTSSLFADHKQLVCDEGSPVKVAETRAGDQQQETIVVYEIQRDLLKLNEHLQGSGSIRRTFTRTPATRVHHNKYYHTSVRLEVFIVDKAHLVFTVNNLKSSECGDIIGAAKAQECYEDSDSDVAWRRSFSFSSPHSIGEFPNKRLRAFEMIFEPNKSSEVMGGGGGGGCSLSRADFELARHQLERSFLRMLLASPERVPVMQVGEHLILFEASRSNIIMQFNLLEPISLVHEFELLEERTFQTDRRLALQSLHLTGETRILSSHYRCSDDCEATQGRCLAFSYCQDRTCSLLRGIDSGEGDYYAPATVVQTDDRTSKGLKEFLESKNVIENAKCSLWYAPAYRAPQRRYIKSIVASIENQLAFGQQENANNKFAFSLEVASLRGRESGARNDHALSYVARELRELTSHIDRGVDSRSRVARNHDDGDEDQDDFVIYLEQSELEIDKITATDFPNLRTSMFMAHDLGDCLDGCHQQACQLASFCGLTRICALVANITTWDTELRRVINRRVSGPGQTHCSIYSKDFTRDYEHFPATRPPKDATSSADNFSLLECAAYCEFQRQEDDQGRESRLTECLSFDYCYPPVSATHDTHHHHRPQPKCYLQKTHVIMDDFDDRILDTATNSDASDPTQDGLSCSHYSRSLLADFDVSRGKKFAEHKSIVFQDMPLDRCALVCRRDETCQSFEYCRGPSAINGTQTGPNTCYLRRHPKLAPVEGNATTSTVETIGTNLTEVLLESSSEHCSVYTYKDLHIMREEAADQATSLGLIITLKESDQNDSLYFGVIHFMWLVVSLCLGSLIGYAHQACKQRATKNTNR